VPVQWNANAATFESPVPPLFLTSTELVDPEILEAMLALTQLLFAAFEDEAVAALPVVFWLSVGKVQFVKVPLEGVPKASPTAYLVLNVFQSVAVKYPLTEVVA
jgi:hypothetical protein